MKRAYTDAQPAGGRGELRQNTEFLSKAYRAALIPNMLSILSGCINILADGVLVGRRTGTDGLAAINLCVPVYLVLCVLGSFFVSGTAIPATRKIGAGERDAAQRCATDAMGCCLLASAAAAVAGIFCSDALAASLSAAGPVRRMVRDYTAVTLIGALPKLLIYIPFWYLRLDGKNTSITAMMVLMGGGNVLLDILFLFVLDLGVFGAALASVLATAAACALGFARLWRAPGTFRPGVSLPDRRALAAMAADGSPAALNNLMQTLRLLAVNALLLRYGGNEALAVFTVVNGISAFAEAVTVGVPQAGSAMLGIYFGEHDNGSAEILLRREARSGILLSAVFGAALVVGADLIRRAYGLDVPLYFPLACLALSLIPALLCNILSGYYNVAGRFGLANLIVLGRVFLFSAGSLLVLLALGASPWWFLPLAELCTLLVWLGVTRLLSRRPHTSRYLLTDTTLDESGRILNFSLGSDDADICDASERITGFCEDNGMAMKEVMRVSLAIEELMTLISHVNVPSPVRFDIRVFSLQGVIGIRVRYDGRDFNPMEGDENDDAYLGVRLLRALQVTVEYARIFGKNSLMILI